MFFGGFAKFDSSYSNVTTGRADPLGLRPGEVVQGDVKRVAQGLHKLPAPSQGAAAAEAKRAEYMTMAAKMHKQIVTSRAAQLKAIAEMHKDTVTHEKNFMQTSKTIAKSEGDFRKALMEHGLTIATEQAEIDGYEEALRGAKTLWK